MPPLRLERRAEKLPRRDARIRRSAPVTASRLVRFRQGCMLERAGGSRSEKHSLSIRREAEAESGTRTEWRGGVWGRSPDQNRSRLPHAGRLLPGVLEGQSLRT